MTVKCRICQSLDTALVSFQLPDTEPDFFRCNDCGSDTSELNYEDVARFYSTEYAIQHRESGGGHASMKDLCSVNCRWFDIDPWDVSKTFLDVGSFDGSALDNMKEQGWDVQGFDVIKPDDNRHPVLTAPEFRASLFWPKRFGAVLSREGIEHVPNAHQYLKELVKVAKPGGLVQIQTPVPGDKWTAIQYQSPHLCLIHPGALRTMLVAAGLEIIDSLRWPLGQAHMCRKPR